jgi:hypothetical protein
VGRELVEQERVGEPEDAVQRGPQLVADLREQAPARGDGTTRRRRGEAAALIALELPEAARADTKAIWTDVVEAWKALPERAPDPLANVFQE